MTPIIIDLVRLLHTECTTYPPSILVRTAVIHLYGLSQQIPLTVDIHDEMEKIIFKLIDKISNDRTVHNGVILVFSELVVEVINYLSANNQPVMDLVDAFNSMKIIIR